MKEGHIDDSIPSFAISLYQDFWGQGIGTSLMEEYIMVCDLCETNVI